MTTWKNSGWTPCTDGEEVGVEAELEDGGAAGLAGELRVDGLVGEGAEGAGLLRRGGGRRRPYQPSAARAPCEMAGFPAFMASRVSGDGVSAANRLMSRTGDPPFSIFPRSSFSWASPRSMRRSRKGSLYFGGFARACRTRPRRRGRWRCRHARKRPRSVAARVRRPEEVQGYLRPLCATHRVPRHGNLVSTNNPMKPLSSRLFRPGVPRRDWDARRRNGPQVSRGLDIGHLSRRPTSRNLPARYGSSRR